MATGNALQAAAMIAEICPKPRRMAAPAFRLPANPVWRARITPTSSGVMYADFLPALSHGFALVGETVRTVFTSTGHVGRSELDALHFLYMPPEPAPGPVATAPDETKFTLTVDQAAQRFVAAGFPRSPRSIQRYCQLGHLRAISMPTENGRIYLIDEKSVEERIEELRQVAPFSRPQGDDSRRDDTRHDATERDETRHSTTSRVELEEALKRIKDLETETRTLEIDKRVRDAMLEQMQKDRERLLNDLQHFVETMNDQSRQIGRLEAQLALLDAPKGDNSRAREGDNPVQ